MGAPAAIEPESATNSADRDTAAIPAEATTFRRLLRFADFRNISAIYLWIALFVMFAFWTPHTFLVLGTWRGLADQQAVTTMLALGLVISLAAGVFDLSAALTLGASNVTVAWAVSIAHWPAGVALLSGVAIGVIVGLVNSLLVIELGIASFIATLATSSVLTAYVNWRSNDQQIQVSNPTFVKFSTYQILGLPWPVWAMLVLAVVIWYVLRYRPIGRYLYAAGGSPDAARLAGVRTNLVSAGALMASSTIAAVTGAVLTLRIGIGSPTIGSPYLIPAFTAAFLGSTQLGRGRFNVWGTVIAVYALATGTKGLNLVGGPYWLPDLFNGIALVLAVGFSASTSESPFRNRLRRGFRGRRESGRLPI
jgi:ribose transport system permease protein